MPRLQPRQSFRELRNYTEQWTWVDPISKQRCTGFNPPRDAFHVERKPFVIVYITKGGELQRGECVCIRVDTRKQMRLVQFVASQEIRWVRDYLVVEVDGVRFYTH